MRITKLYILATAFILISAVSFCQENNDVSTEAIEQAPIYPGCEIFKTNPELKRCLSQKISEFVGRNLLISVGKSSPIAGRQRISVKFRINKEGEVDNIKARGPHPAIEREVIRVLGELPRMQPGTQLNKPLGVLYSLPIVFGKETKEQKKARKKQERKNKKG